MGYFPPDMYDPQINMISKPFELKKKRLRKDFMSPKYENRRKEFFATFFEFLQTHIRKKYYDFMNDIQTEVNFFEWFDKYYKPKILTDRNTNFLLQKEATYRTIITKATNTRHIIPNTRPLITNTIITKASPNIIITKAMTTNMTTNNRHIIPKTRPLTTNHANIIPNTRHIIFDTRLLTKNHAIADNIHFAKKKIP